MPDGPTLVACFPRYEHLSMPADLLSAIPEQQADQMTLVRLDLLRPANSPRLDGVDPGHAQALAEVDTGLPPILVMRSTMQVIDGMHRLDAARIRGQETISVQYFDGNEEDAFLLAVAANVKHGLPLTLADRRMAAARIISLRPEASDRWIAELAGLAAKTVAAIRRSAPEPEVHLAGRIGRDGRFRPLSSADGRRAARELFTTQPSLSLRQIARHAGISVGTARDVREKMRQGIDPVQRKQPGTGDARAEAKSAAKKQAEAVDYVAILQRLHRDPSLRYTESGRSLLRWLCPPRLVAPSDWSGIVSTIPLHWTLDIARIAKGCALAWSELADELEQRHRDCG
jgi:ParB-like chromosome segregation protein Spo0J